LAALAALGASVGITAQAQTPFAPRPAPPASVPGVPNAPNAPAPAIPPANPPAQAPARPAGPGAVIPPAPEIVGEGPMFDAMRAYRARDFATALRMWREEAQKGDAQAMVNAGEMYAYGIGVPEDFAEAVRWFRRAADTGDMVGQFSLAFMYENGRGVPQNITEARRLYTLSANQGYYGAIEALRDIRDPVQVPRPTTPGTPRRTQ
jgi:hypothetical protein